MEIGDLVTHGGRAYVVLGFEPMSVVGRRAEVEDPETGERSLVRLAELDPAEG